MDPILLVRCDALETFGITPSAVEAADALVTIWDAVAGAPRPSLEDISGVVLYGSTYNVEHAEDQPFIKEARELTLEAMERGLPYLGICFGAQMLAWSLDAPIVKAPVREVGFEVVHPTAEAADDPLLSHHDDGDHGFQWHMDTFELPADATLLAAGDRVRNQAFRVGDRTWGVQWHLEVDRDELEQWLATFERSEGPLEAAWGKSTAEIRAEADELLAGHEARGREVFRRLAALARAARPAA